MKTRRWPVRLIAGILMTAALIGVAYAAGQQGSQSDPLVTLSYLTDKVTPDILAQVDARLAQQEKALAAQLSQAVSQYLQEGGTGAAGTAGDSYVVVTLRQGQTLTAETGCEVLLRSGSAACTAASEPGLVDMTSGETLSSGGGLSANHLYLSTADGRGVRASSDATLLVRGVYSIF